MVNFIRLAIKILRKDRNRPARRYQVTSYMFKTLININKFVEIELLYQNAHFFLLDICCKPMIYLKVAEKDKICSSFLELQKAAANAKCCSNVADHNRDSLAVYCTGETEQEGN